MARRYGIQVLARWKVFDGPRQGVPPPSFDPFARNRGTNAGGDAVFHFRKRADADQVDVQFQKAAGSQVQARGVEFGDGESPVEVDDFGLASAVGFENLLGRTD